MPSRCSRTFVAHGLGGRCAERLAWLVDLVIDRLTDPTGVMPYLYRPDWRPVPDVMRIGQQFQMIHRLVAAAAVNGVMGPVARSLRTRRLLSGVGAPSVRGLLLRRYRGRPHMAVDGPSTDLRQWWVQLEAAHALHVLATHEAIDRDARARYGRARDEQWEFVRDHFFDTRSGGIWELAVESSTRWRARLPRWLQPRPPDAALAQDLRLEGPASRGRHIPRAWSGRVIAERRISPSPPTLCQRCSNNLSGASADHDVQAVHSSGNERSPSGTANGHRPARPPSPTRAASLKMIMQRIDGYWPNEPPKPNWVGRDSALVLQAQSVRKLYSVKLAAISPKIVQVLRSSPKKPAAV